MLAALGHAKIVERKPGVLLLQQFCDSLLAPGQLRIIHNHRVVVNDQVDVVTAQALALHVINTLVAFQRVFPVVHLHVEAGKPLSRAVIVNHQVVVPQNLGLLGYVIHDFLPQLGICAFSQQGRDGVFCQLYAAVQDEQRHAQTDVAVHRQSPEMLNQSRSQNGGGGNAVVAAVGRGGQQGGGVDFLAQLPVKQGHPQLHSDGCDQHPGCHGGKFHRRGMENLLGGAFHQLKADYQNQGGHCKAA